MHDFPEIPGLAHFLEHMLFMGSEKYPKEDHFSTFMHDHGGYKNGCTYEEKTIYFFNINAKYLSSALDM